MERGTMMKCGHAAQCSVSATGAPYCLICDCAEVATQPPDLTGRKARCGSYGRTPMYNRGARCDFTPQEAGKCLCERPSDPKLAFFEHKPSEPFDRFYCGCHGWD